MQQSQLFSSEFLGHWSATVVPLVGMLAALAVFWGGRCLFGRRRPAQLALADLSLDRALPPRPAKEESWSAAAPSMNWKAPPVTVLISDATAKVEPVRGCVFERWADGMTMEVFEEGGVDVGTIVSIRPCEAADTIPWVQIEVQSCRRNESTWTWQCRFVRTPIWAVRMLLGFQR